MNSPVIFVTDTPQEEDLSMISGALDAFNIEQTGIADRRPLAVLVRDADNRVVGGLTGRTSLGLLFLDLFYLPPALRGGGLGREILRQAEAEGVRRGCRSAVLYTISFQAPEFYKKQGWTVFGEVECDPPGTRRIFLKKDLDQRAISRRKEMPFELVRFAESYSKEFFQLTDKNRIHLKKWLPWLDKMTKVEDSAGFIRGSLRLERDGQVINYFIVCDQRLVGTIGVRDIKAGSGLIGYWIDEGHQAKGLVTAACKQVVHACFDSGVVKQLVIRCGTGNVASRSVALKCGFKYVETLKDAETLYGRTHDLDVYALSAE